MDLHRQRSKQHGPCRRQSIEQFHACRSRHENWNALTSEPGRESAAATFGNVVIEALATGVPVIAYDRGGPAEIVIDAATGFVVPADDIDALAETVARIDTIDSLAGRRYVEGQFSTEALANASTPGSER